MNLRTLELQVSLKNFSYMSGQEKNHYLEKIPSFGFKAMPYQVKIPWNLISEYQV
jgi:hypothetical protein